MALDIGQRVTSNFTGDGTVTGGLTRTTDKDDDGKTIITGYQEVTFDNPTLGTRAWEVKKLNPLD
jgi:hypothetical protein